MRKTSDPSVHIIRLPSENSEIYERSVMCPPPPVLRYKLWHLEGLKYVNIPVYNMIVQRDSRVVHRIVELGSPVNGGSRGTIGVLGATNMDPPLPCCTAEGHFVASRSHTKRRSFDEIGTVTFREFIIVSNY